MWFVLRCSEENAILLPGHIPGYKCDDLQFVSFSTMGVVSPHCLGVGRSPCSLLLPLLLAVAANHSTGCCDQANLRLVLDLPTKKGTLIIWAHIRPVEEKSEVKLFINAQHV